MKNPNLRLTILMARRLEPLLPELTFVGGCATGLLITDPASAPVRATRDVDVIAQIASYAEYSNFSERLRELGFREDDTEDAPLCRWTIDNMSLDVMPTNSSILGFTNRWYEPAIRSAVEVEIDAGFFIRLVTGPLFLGTKMEAFKTRGCGDFRASHDLEDVIAVVDGRIELVEEARSASPELRHYLAITFSEMLVLQSFRDALPGHLFPDPASQKRLSMILERLTALSKLVADKSP